MSNNTDQLSTRRYVSYLDLGGGLNTKKDAHALNRNQLALSVNCWYAGANSISKRPGSAAVVTAQGSTGAGVGAKGLAGCRFSNNTYFIVQQGTALYAAKTSDVSFTSIGTLGASPNNIQTAQMYDPDTAKDTVFICDGVESPRIWTGPGNSIAAMVAGAGSLPQQMSGGLAFKPKYVSTIGNNSHLFFAGDALSPSAVYISDSLYPTRFQSNSSLSSFYPGTYIPYIVGNNDGVAGGDITGIKPLYSSMFVYKQAAIYRMDQMGLYGDLIWRTSIVSASVGCTAPRSIVQFDDFHCFLGIDGVYQTNGVTTRKISDNVPTYFDSSLSGVAATITDRTSAVGVRHGNRYLIFFDDGSGVPARGLWFDFNKLDENGLPTVGEIQGMKVGGAIPLRGPGDDGNIIWADASADRVGKFGIGFSDFGNAIQTTFAGKADFFADYFPDKGPLTGKIVQDVTLCLSLPQQGTGGTLTFIATQVSDLLNAYSGSGIPLTVTAPATGSWGQNWGSMVWTSSGAAAQYQISKIQSQDVPPGHVIQFIFQESSTFQWTCLGYEIEMNEQEIAA